jgi:hypothetical protein
MALGAVTGAVVFKHSDQVSARLNGDPFHLQNRVGVRRPVSERMTSEEMTSLALARDIPLFLVRGRIVAD